MADGSKGLEGPDLFASSSRSLSFKGFLFPEPIPVSEVSVFPDVSSSTRAQGQPEELWSTPLLPTLLLCLVVTEP